MIIIWLLPVKYQIINDYHIWLLPVKYQLTIVGILICYELPYITTYCNMLHLYYHLFIMVIHS
jgi:hypothetical protein